jgi:hypothetical protein
MQACEVVFERRRDRVRLEAEVAESLRAPRQRSRCYVPLPASQQGQGLRVIETLLGATQLFGRGGLGCGCGLKRVVQGSG